MNTFKYLGHPADVVFGVGVFDQVQHHLEQRGFRRVLIVSTPEQKDLAERAASLLGPMAVGIHPHAAMHVPIEVARTAIDRANSVAADCILGAGGGSTIGLGKAIALESSIPVVAIPTTYAGSEMTPIYGITEGRLKKTGRDARVLPKLVLYDPQLTATLPKAMTVTSGMNAIAHAVEALYAVDGNPIVTLMAEEGIRAIASALPLLSTHPLDIGARSECLYGAWLCGSVLGTTSMAIHHKLCHTLGGTFNLPHAETHTIILPHAVAYNAKKCPDAMHRLCRALGAQDAAQGLFELAKSCGATLALRDIGMPRAGIEEAAALAMKNPYANPEPVTFEGVKRLLNMAWEGERPA